MAYQAHRLRLSGTFIVERIAPIRRAQRVDLLLQPRLQKLIDAGKASTANLLDMHSEINAALVQDDRHPVGRVSSVEQQDIILASPVELFEQHLALTDIVAVQRRQEHQFGIGQKQAKHQLSSHVRALDMAGAQAKAYARGISDDQPKTLPALQVAMLLCLFDEPVRSG